MNTKPPFSHKRRALLRQGNRQQTSELVSVPKFQWPAQNCPSRAERLAVWRSKDFLVQVFKEGAFIRLSINRTSLAGPNLRNWADAITWDELQHIKNAVGYGTQCAVEIYPPHAHVVNVANMRHLWIDPSGPPACMWQSNKQTTTPPITVLTNPPPANPAQS